MWYTLFMKVFVKKWICAAVAAMLLAASLSGCGVFVEPEAEPQPLRLCASFYPVYALTLPLISGVDGLALSCLTQPQAGCPRSYVLSDWDAGLIAAQDAMLIAGRGFESFEAALTGIASGPAVVIAESGLTLEKNGVSTDENGHWAGDNPWLFLSVDGAREMTISLATGLSGLDPDYTSAYAHNMDVQTVFLDQLEADIAALMAPWQGMDVAVAHEGLSYFARSLGLNVTARAEREPGSDPYGNDLQAILETLEEGGARVVLVERQAPQNFIEALKAHGYVPARIDTLMTRAADGNPRAYTQIMYDNARIAAEAFALAAGDGETEE